MNIVKRLKNLWVLSGYRLDFDDDGITQRTHPILKKDVRPSTKSAIIININHNADGIPTVK